MGTKLTSLLRPRRRAKAADQISRKQSKGDSAGSAEQILHQLQVHQVELEMQNEALRQKQIELDEARTRYLDLFEFAPVGYLTLTIDGMISEINLTACSLLGMDRLNLLHRQFVSLVVAEDQDRWIVLCKNVRENAGKSSVELKMERGDGALFRAQLDCSRSEGIPLGLRIVLSDISQRVMAEEQLRLTRFSVEATSEALFWITPDARIVDVNEAACRSLCYTRAELLEMSVPDVDVRYSAELWPLHFAELRKRGTMTLESEHRTKDGRVIPVEVVANYLEYDGMAINCAFVRNIEARKQAEAEHNATKSQLQATLDAIPDLLFEVGLDGLIYDYRAQRTELLAVLPEIFIGKRFAEVLPHDAADVCFAAIREASNKGCSLGRTYSLQLAEGERWFEISVAPKYTTSDQDRRFVFIARDITERKKAELSLSESAAQLRELTAHLRRVREQDRIHFARELHDELGQNLTALRMDFDGLIDDLAPTPPVIVSRLATLDRMIDTTVDSTRRICEDLRPAILDDLGLEAALSSYVRRFTTQFGVPCDLLLDHEDYGLEQSLSTEIFRIVQEALTNIARHARASHATVALEDHGEDLLLTIADDGCGMSDPVPGARRSYGLLGMQERVMMLGGRIAIDSASGRGTHIDVSIPRSPKVTP